MRVLVGCEFSGVVREAFRHRGHDAWSCDLLPPEDGSPHHFQCDVMRKVGSMCPDFDLAIFHPPCRFLAVSGARWWNERKQEQREALDFVMHLSRAMIPRIAIENPISIISTVWRKPDQIIQPWMFGHPEFKATCLWLKNLPKLVPTNQLTPPKKGTQEYKDWSRVHRASPGPERWKERSRTLVGLAEAMAAQWGSL